MGLGRLGEQLAARFLQTKGYQIVQRNFYVRGGEVDIIAEINGILVFVEVKTRNTQRSGRFGAAAESITAFKKRNLLRAVAIYLRTIRFSSRFRVDLIAIDFATLRTAKISHHQNIFET